jgi:hypothetical protein
MLAFFCQLRASTALALTLLATLLVATQAAALSFSLSSEFDGVEPVADYATVAVTQNANGDDLDFSIALNDLLGPREDAHQFYFNLIGSFTGLSIISSNAPNTEYRLIASPEVVGGAGSSFDFGVNLGNGAGQPGNGVLTLATFTLSADQALMPSDLLESSYTSQGIEAQVALSVQSTSTRPRSETVGGVVSLPEPSTVLLLAAGLAGLALKGRPKRD